MTGTRTVTAAGDVTAAASHASASTVAIKHTKHLLVCGAYTDVNNSPCALRL